MKPFNEIKPPLPGDEALAEANRCLMCFDAPCTRACPTHIDVPAFIKKIASGNLRGSARTIFGANIFGGSCARVCPTEVLCEGACVLNDLHHKPIDIGRLQRHATDWLQARGERVFGAAPDAGLGRVAIVGGGPAGIACAAELARLGVRAVVFDGAPLPGGLNTYGCAEYKITADFAVREIDWIREHGVEIRSGARVGAGDRDGEVSLARLEAEYDALFIGVGLGKINALGIPGEDLPGVVDSLDFIAELKTDPERLQVGRRVVVVGGGNTAIDAVTQSAALGAEEVWLVYRRAEKDMPAYVHERELARRWGARFVLQAAPVRVVGDGRVEGIEFLRQRLGEPDTSGKSAMEPIPGSEFLIPCDMVLKANGQAANARFLESLPGVELRKGRPVVDANLQTTNPRYFAGGDCISGGQEVVNAVAEGKRAAQGIVNWLKQRRPSTSGGTLG